MKGSRWIYYVLPEDIGEVTFTVTSDRPVSVYIRKSMGLLPDSVNFDSLVKKESRIEISTSLMTFTEGVMIAVHCEGTLDETTSFEAQVSQLQNIMVHNSFEFLDLAAVPAPSSA